MKNVDTKEQIKVFSGACLADKTHPIINPTEVTHFFAFLSTPAHRLRVSSQQKAIRTHLSLNRFLLIQAAGLVATTLFLF